MAKQILLGELDRNDVKGALAYARQELAAERLTIDSVRMLLHLQDDSEELGAALDDLIGERDLPEFTSA